jgi:hypothetical protein
VRRGKDEEKALGRQRRRSLLRVLIQARDDVAAAAHARIITNKPAMQIILRYKCERGEQRVCRTPSWED